MIPACPQSPGSRLIVAQMRTMAGIVENRKQPKMFFSPRHFLFIPKVNDPKLAGTGGLCQAVQSPTDIS